MQKLKSWIEILASSTFLVKCTRFKIDNEELKNGKLKNHDVWAHKCMNNWS